VSEPEAGSHGDPGEEAFAAALDRIRAAHPGLPDIEAGLLAALRLGLPGDSRAFARTFEVEHALVLRALSGLDEAGLVTMTSRDGRTQRTRYEPRGVPPGGD
jgi:hypothetical protein